MNTCSRSVIRAGEDQPCDRPAVGLAFDPEGQVAGLDGDGFYSACRDHVDRRLPFLLERRPEFGDLMQGAGASLAVAAA